MTPSATILQLLNQQTGIQYPKYESFLKKFFVQVATALTALGNAQGAVVLTDTNGFPNQAPGYYLDWIPIFLSTATGLTALGQTATGTAITNFFKQHGKQDQIYGDQIMPLLVEIQVSLSALGE